MRYIVAIFILLIGFMALFTLPSACADEGAKIIYLKGQVKVQHSGDDFWILAKKGMILNSNDKIKTYVASSVEIALDSTLKNIVKIDPDSEITLEDIEAKRLYMSKGKVLSVIESLPGASSFEVRTPTAVAGVAGSGMSVGTDGKDTTVSCFEDKAYVRGIDVDGTPMLEIIIIDEGYKRMVGRFEMPGELMALTAFDRENWSKFREDLSEHLDWLREKRAEGSREAALAMQQIQRIQERSEDIRFEDKENIFEADEQDRRDSLFEKEPANDSNGGY